MISLAVQSCERKDVIIQSKQNDFVKSTSKNNLPNNMLAGEIHNKILEEVINTVRTTDGSKKSKFELSINLSNKIYDQSFEQEIGNVEDISPAFIQNVLNDRDNMFKDVISASAFSVHGKEVLTQYVNLFFDSINGAPLSYQEFATQIDNFEKKLPEKDFSENEFEVIKSIISIGKSSSYFWYSNINQSSFTSRKWWQWLVIAVCDVAGGIAGAGLGVGVVSVASSIAGAAAASASADQLVN